MDVLLFESLGIGAVLGLLLGLTGAGGSLVALPLLLSLHLPLRDAIGVSLGAVALSALASRFIPAPRHMRQADQSTSRQKATISTPSGTKRPSHWPTALLGRPASARARWPGAAPG